MKCPRTQGSSLNPVSECCAMRRASRAKWMKGVMDRPGDEGDLHRLGGRRVLGIRPIGNIGQSWRLWDAA